MFVLFCTITPRAIGKFVLGLIQNKRYQSMMLPPIPVVVKREWDVNVLKLETLDNREVMPGEIHVGDSVMGFYGVDLMWYPAKVLRVLSPNSYYIIYDTYNNKEVRTRGHILMNGEDPMSIVAKANKESDSDASDSSRRSRSSSRSRRSHHHHRSRSRSRSRSHSHRRHHRSPRRDDSERGTSGLFDEKRLAELAREKERQAAVSDGHASNVGHVKQSLMLKMDRFTARKEDYVPEKPVIVKTIEVEDSLAKAKAEEERKKKEAENKKRLEAIQRMYSRDKEEDGYNRDYYSCVCSLLSSFAMDQMDQKVRKVGSGRSV